MDLTVLSEFNTSCRLAGSPTMISPDLVKETIDGVVLFPSAFGMTSIEPSGFTHAITE